MSVIRRVDDLQLVTRGWVDGAKKRKSIHPTKRKNQSRPETLYCLGYQAAAKRRSYGQTIDEYKDLIEQERLDASEKAVELAEKEDGSRLLQEVEEEGDAVFEDIADLEEGDEEGGDVSSEQEADEEGSDLTLEDEANIETFDVQADLMLLEEEEDL